MDKTPASHATSASIADRIQALLSHYGLNASSATKKLGYGTTSKMYKILQGAEPSYPTIVDFLSLWPAVSPDWLLLGNGSMFRGGVTDTGESTEKKAEKKNTLSRAVTDRQVLTVTVDRQGEENTLMIPARAQAGYARSFNEAVYLQQMRPYHIPGFEHGTYRAFEVSGDSMEPTINHRDIVVSQYVDRWDLLQPGEIYVVVTHENILLKRIPRRITNRNGMVDLLSDNPMVKPYDLPAADIVQLWVVLGYISTYIPTTPDITSERLWEVIELLGHDRGEVRRYLMETSPNDAPNSLAAAGNQRINI